MHHWRPLLWVVMAAVVAACGREVADSSSEKPNLTAKDFTFEPAELTAPAGDETTFHVVNAGDAKHNITIEELGVDQDVDVRGLADFSFTAEQPGEFEFFCKYHATQMTGTLTVE